MSSPLHRAAISLRGCSGSRRTILKGTAALVAASTLPAFAAEPISFAHLAVKGEEFSDAAKKLAGSEVEMKGYMAPPLKPEVSFFVLTRLPAATCPFCDSTATWPDDIVVVFMRRRGRTVDVNDLIKVRGILDLGPKTDQSTGFLSLVRLQDAEYRRA
jgi:hypothetical protein